MSGHDTGVRHIPTAWRPHLAVCSCGWQHPFDNLLDAEDSAVNHELESMPVRCECLRERYGRIEYNPAGCGLHKHQAAP